MQPKVRDRLQEAGSGPNGAVRFLASAHASTEELFVLKYLVEGLLGNDGLGAVTIAWTGGQKPQPSATKFKVPPTDAPNVNGARDLGFAVGTGNDAPPDLTAFRTAIEGGPGQGAVRPRPRSRRIARRRLLADRRTPQRSAAAADCPGRAHD